MYDTASFIETVEVFPHELSNSPDKIAKKRLIDLLLERPNVQKIISFEQNGPPEVIRRRGTLHYYFNVKVEIFNPQENQIIDAKLVDVIPIGVILMVKKMRCIIPETFLKEQNVKCNLQMKSISFNNQTFTCGSILKIKLFKIKKLERNGQEEKQAIAMLVLQ